MSRTRPVHRLITVFGVLILATSAMPRPSLAAWPHSPGLNVPVCTATNDQLNPKAVSDGAGGAIIAWYDLRSGNYDVYAQRVLVSGVVDPTWPANGRALCTAAGEQSQVAIASDGAGGAIVTWIDFRNAADFDIYAQHVQASGAVDPAWPANGQLMCGAAGNQLYPKIASDGAAGAIVTWQDARVGGGVTDIYAQRMRANGTVDPAWPVNGQALCTAANNQEIPELVSDGAGGAIVTWYDLRTGVYDVYAQRVLASGAVDGAWPADGRVLCNASDGQYRPVILADGAGGAIVTWYDLRNGGNGFDDIYAQHIFASGVVDPAWPSNGRALCNAANYQYNPSILSDGAGGAIVAWLDTRNGTGNHDIYAQHVLSTGAVDGAWPVDGRALCNASFNQVAAVIASDGASGAIVAWNDGRNPNTNTFAQRVLASGTVDPGWPLDGRAVSLISSGGQGGPTIVSDAAGGAIVAWQDSRSNGVNFDIYAQRVAPSGYLGNPEPAIASVRDVPNDQGGKVKLSWSASYLDTEQPYFIDHYSIFRSAPPNTAAQASIADLPVLRPGASVPLAPEGLIATLRNTTTYTWEFLTNSPAAHLTATYGYVATTNSDSMGAGNPRTAFLVVGYNASNTVYFLSNPDSGYSVDNLPPVAPAPLTGNYATGATYLHWDPNPEDDVAFYDVHRGTSADFVPSAENLLASQPDTGYVDVGWEGSYYKLAAVDVHGNRSEYALLAPSTTLDAGDAPRALAFGRPAPNPAAVLASVHLALPRAALLRVAVHDVAGRQVRSLLREHVPAGVRDVTWDLRDDTGSPVANGLYFVQLQFEGRTFTRHLAVVR